MKLASIVKRLDGKTEDDLQRQIAELTAEKRIYARANNGTHRDQVHAAADKLVADARAGLTGTDVTDARNLLAGTSFEHFFRSFVLASPDFEKALRARIDGAPDALFASGTRGEYEEKLAAFDARISEIEIELQRREIVARKDDADAELAALEGVTTS